VYALVAVAAYDAMVGCRDAKYTYWTARPYQFDPTIATLLPKYNHPSYPSAHACVAGATSTVLADLFPREGSGFARDAQELATSRWQAGIHFRSDVEAGLTLGQAVAGEVIEWAMHDGALTAVAWP
jgi:membrane-associated phospholipid phosphatase